VAMCSGTPHLFSFFLNSMIAKNKKALVDPFLKIKDCYSKLDLI